MSLSDLICSLEEKLSADRPLGPSAGEIRRRRARVAAALTDLGGDAFVGFSAVTIAYLTGWATTNTERPVAVIANRDGTTTLFAPQLRAADATAQAIEATVVSYPEYPGLTHPMRLLGMLLSDLGHRRLVIESKGYHSPFGYHGPRLADTVCAYCVVERDLVDKLRMVKSPEEIELIRHAGDWALLAQAYLQDAIVAGASESAIGGVATARAMRRFRAAFCNRTAMAWPAQISASFGGQVGAAGTAVHAHILLDPILAPGDPLISKVAAYIGGYYCDIERSMTCATASRAYRSLFAHGIELQEYALAMVRPGVAVAEIDRMVRERARKLGFEDHWRHHVGHSVGLQERERPYIDIGSQEILQPGMVVTVEPGLYKDGVGGFRHSDCVVVTAAGHDNLTPYPHDFDFLAADHTSKTDRPA